MKTRLPSASEDERERAAVHVRQWYAANRGELWRELLSVKSPCSAPDLDDGPPRDEPRYWLR